MKLSKDWDTSITDFWVGGTHSVKNTSGGYHGLLQQWWDHYKPINADWLLISEKNDVKSSFQVSYPKDSFSTLEYYSEDVDYQLNLCDRNFPNLHRKFDIILCQATLEHVYDPFTAVLNMTNLLSKNGVLLLHTHDPSMFYHPYPRDYFRFYSDWFIDLPNNIKNIELVELYNANSHFFAAYKNIGD